MTADALRFDVPELSERPERFIRHLIEVGSAQDRWEAVIFLTGFLQGIRTTTRSPEWAQAVVAEDDRGLGDSLPFFQARVDALVSALPVAATTKPPEPPA